VPVSLNVQASFSRETFDDEIRDPTASLVLARFPLGYAHDPVGGAALVAALVVPVGCGELHPDASTAAVAAMVSVRPYLAARCLIKTTFFCSLDVTAPEAVRG